jgi:hypothetical protein
MAGLLILGSMPASFKTSARRATFARGECRIDREARLA